MTITFRFDIPSFVPCAAPSHQSWSGQIPPTPALLGLKCDKNAIAVIPWLLESLNKQANLWIKLKFFTDNKNLPRSVPTPRKYLHIGYPQNVVVFSGKISNARYFTHSISLEESSASYFLCKNRNLGFWNELFQKWIQSGNALKWEWIFEAFSFPKKL